MSHAVGPMDECNMAVANCTGSYSTLPAPSVTGMTSLTSIMLVNLGLNLGFAFSCDSNGQVDNKLVGHLSTRFGIKNCRVVLMNLPHAKTHFHVSHFGH